MNTQERGDLDPHHSFQLLSELEQEQLVSQRELASRMGVAVGLVNSYLKALVAKGYIRVKSFPRNRYAYLLTPKGIAEKSRLAVSHLGYLTRLYRDARKDYRTLFASMAEERIPAVSFCGADEVAEIAYLSLLESGVKLVRVVDVGTDHEPFMGFPVESIGQLMTDDKPVVITSAKRKDVVHSALLEAGVPARRIYLPHMLETHFSTMENA